MKNILLPLTLAVWIGLIVSCAPPAEKASAPAPGSAKIASSPAEMRSAPADGLPKPDQAYSTRKQVKTGSATIEAQDLDAVEKAIGAKVEGLGGFLEHSTATPDSRTFTLRIPAASFDGFFQGLGTWGRVSSKQVDVADVTVQYYDLETRLKNQKLLLDRYRELLAKTQKMDELLAIMEKTNQLTTDIESTEGQFRYLSRQVDFSTLEITLTLPLLAEGRSWPDLGQGIAELIHTLADFGVGLLAILIAAAIIGPALFGLLALLVWLWLGKPGLWRRLKALRTPHEKPPASEAKP